RRVSLTNHGTRTREIDVTSYAEVVLAEPAADASHPAFSNLFVQTEAVPELDTLLATRRARSRDETPVWLAHVARVEGEAIGALARRGGRARRQVPRRGHLRPRRHPGVDAGAGPVASPRRQARRGAPLSESRRPHPLSAAHAAGLRGRTGAPRGGPGRVVGAR